MPSGTASSAATATTSPAAIGAQPLAFVVGLVLAWTGIALRWWSFKTLGRYFTIRVQTSADQPVISSGPYSLLRHPGYTGVELVLLGVGFLYGNWVGVAAMAVLPMIGLVNRIRVEQQALDELRRVLGVVRPGEERSPDFAPQPTLARLESLLDQVRAAGLEVDLDIAGEARELPPALELSAYRIVQEALTNTLRHADANRATVTLQFEPDALGVEIVDDGTPSGEGNGAGRHGLIGMRERAAAFGGQVETERIAAGGFRVAARLPLASVEK